MQSLTVPLSRGKPICGQRLSTAYTWPLCQKSATTCCLASTVKRPSACSAARVPTRTHCSSVWGWACVVTVIPHLLFIDGHGPWATTIAPQASMMQEVTSYVHGVRHEPAPHISKEKTLEKTIHFGD